MRRDACHAMQCGWSQLLLLALLLPFCHVNGGSNTLYLTEESVEILATRPAGPSFSVLGSLLPCTVAPVPPQQQQTLQQQQLQQQQLQQQQQLNYQHPATR